MTTAIPVPSLPTVKVVDKKPPADQVSAQAAQARTQGQQPTSTFDSAARHDAKLNLQNREQIMAENTSAQAPASDQAQTNGLNIHGRKQSVVITASGATGQLPNGAPPTPNARPNISFGSIMEPQQPSPAPAHAVPFASQTSNMPSAKPDAMRITDPSKSPEPIPQPMASGGRPPALAGNSALNFGSMGMDNSEHRLSSQGYNPSYHPQHAQLRREHSQSGHSDKNMGGRPGHMPGSGRGRGSPYAQGQYPGMPSPALSYRQMSTPRVPQSMPQPYPQQAQMNNYRGRNSPAMMHAQPQMPSSAVSSPQMPYAGYNNQQQQQMYGMQSQYDPYAGYYQPYGMQAPYGGPPAHMQSPYHPPSMSRSASQISERPASSMSTRPQSSVVSSPQGYMPPQNATGSGSASANTSTPSATASDFKIPQRSKSKAIVIKNAQGEEIHFDRKKPAQPSAQAVPASPLVVSSGAPAPVAKPTSTPPSEESKAETPRSASKTDDEIKTGFQEQVKKQLEAQREQERKLKGDAPSNVTEPAPPASQPEPRIETPKVETPAVSVETTAQTTTAPEKPADSEPEMTEEERMEREIAEMEAAEKAEEERERKYNEKKAAEKAAKAKVDAANADAKLKQAEKEAEERELAREKERDQPAGDADEKSKADRDLFASLKKPTLGPGAQDGDDSVAPDAVVKPTTSEAPSHESIEHSRHAVDKPDSQLKVNTEKPADNEPTPGMQSLKNARALKISEFISYPTGIAVPKPAMNSSGTKHSSYSYDQSFLLQLQQIFREKPTPDWDQRVRDTLSDEPGSARGGQGRAPSNAGGRSGSSRGQAPPSFGGAMGSFGGGARSLPPGTTSQDRFQASNASGARPPPAGALGGFGSRAGGFPMGSQAMSRTNSLQTMAQTSPRSNTRTKGGSKRGGDRNMSRREEESTNKSMPLTAGLDLKDLEKSATGWTARSIGQPMTANTVGLDGIMAPDMVQRKVKAALNKMTPEKFEKISDEIMAISNQSEREADGRTLRQVIQLTFEKACDEAHWAGMYAKFCHKMLVMMSPNIVDEGVRDKQDNQITGGALFRKYLLNRCQEEFERGWQANLPEKGEGESKEAALLSDEYYVAAAAKRRGLGLIQFIGEMYKLDMLTFRIMSECVKRLLDFQGEPDEAAIENMSKLLRTIGKKLDEAPQREHAMVEMYFERIQQTLDKNPGMPSRSKFMLMDVLDLRKAGWKDTSVKGPKTIQEIHAEAEAAAAAQEAERLRTSQRGGGRMHDRGDARGYGHQGMPPPQDFSRTQVGMSDLKRLHTRNTAQPRQPSQGLGPSLGPGSSLYMGRSSSGRKGPLAPRDGDSSASTSRATTPVVKKDEDKEAVNTNTFSALAALDNAESSLPSPPGSTKASPQPAAAQPSISIDSAVNTDAKN